MSTELIRGAAEAVRQLERACKPITARAVAPQSKHDKANRADGIWLEFEYEALTFDVWFRVEGAYVKATEFDAAEYPDVVIARLELYGAEIDDRDLPQSVRLDIIQACREYHRDAT